MSYDFTADEIFAMAEQIERNGAAFYRQAARSIGDSAGQELLLTLASMEDDHEKTFQAMRATLAQREKSSATFDPQDEAALYLRALADSRVFTDKEPDMSSLREILRQAIEAEKESILFYLGMKELVPEALGKGRLDGIIKEEMGHIRLLSREMAVLRR
jgi:rubrerythrin